MTRQFLGGLRILPLLDSVSTTIKGILECFTILNPWKSNHHFLVRVVSEFHHYLSRGKNHLPKGTTIVKVVVVVDFQGNDNPNISG